MSERVVCDRCGGGVDSAGECLRFPTQCKAAGYARLESEFREAHAERLRWTGEAAEYARALSAERTARRALREALEEIEGLWRRQPRESRNMLLYAAHLARAALAAEPGEGPEAGGYALREENGRQHETLARAVAVARILDRRLTELQAAIEAGEWYCPSCNHLHRPRWGGVCLRHAEPGDCDCKRRQVNAPPEGHPRAAEDGGSK